MKVVSYFCSLLVTILCIAIVLEFGLEQFLPDRYRGYLVEEGDGQLKWALGPFQPAQPATAFNSPVKQEKPEDTLRIISLGASITEGWLSAEAVFDKYGQEWGPESRSSYSRVIEFSLNEISGSSSKKVEVINLGIAAYNVTDVIRMLKDSMQLSPDLFIIHISINETWTAERTKWSSYIDDDIPYLYSELSYQILEDTRASWRTMVSENSAFSPVALGSVDKSSPIVIEPAGRGPGLIKRLGNYQSELARLNKFLQKKQIPALFLIPTQNLAGFEPFGSMAKVGTSEQRLDALSRLLVEALAKTGSEAKAKYRAILDIDDGIAEANYQLGKIYLQENQADKALAHFWKANDRDILLKRSPGEFHEVTRKFLADNSYPYLDVMGFYSANSVSGIVGNDFLYDDVHPDRQAQFDLGTEVVRIIVDTNLLGVHSYAGNLQSLPTLVDYDSWTGFNEESAGKVSYLRAAHNFFIFNRFVKRMSWDPNPDQFLAPILEYLDFANKHAPSDQSRFLTVLLNLFLGNQENVETTIAALDCRASAERAARVHSALTGAGRRMYRESRPQLNAELDQLLVSKGCSK